MKNSQIPNALKSSISNLYEPSGIKLTSDPTPELESTDYGACCFGLDHKKILFRIAKTTPTKVGQFVTLWKRPTPASEIAPFDLSDEIDFVIIHVSDGTHHGQFIFDQTILLSKGVMSKNNQGGKRAIRVYPAWTRPTAKDAIKTQAWQLQYFLPLDQSIHGDLNQVKKFFD
jgi:hypothetical protein